MIAKPKPADPIVAPAPKSIVIQFWDPGCDPDAPTAEFEATYRHTHPNHHEYGVTTPTTHIEIQVPLDAVVDIKKSEAWQMALSLNYVPFDEAIQPGDFYVAMWDDHSYVLRCKEVRHNLVISEQEQYVIASSDCVRIQQPDHVRK